MRTVDMKKILAQKLEEEGTYFRYNDISIKKATREVEGAWDEELDDFGTKKAEGYLVVIKDYEHIRFFIHTEHDNYFGNVVFVTRVNYYAGNEVCSNVIEMVDSKHRDFDSLTRESLIKLGYYIAQRF